MTTSLLYPPIGFTGRARSGKNTAASIMAEALTAWGVPVRLRAFADPLRAALLALDPIVDPAGSDDIEHAWKLSEMFDLGHTWETIKEDARCGPEVRRLLQRFGTESIRALDPDFWVRATVADIHAHPTHLTILTDVRFHNEARVLDRPGRLYAIHRPSLPEDPATSSHSSEALDSVIALADGVIENDSFPLLTHDLVQYAADYFYSVRGYSPVPRKDKTA